jgi:hypothetical protein
MALCIPVIRLIERWKNRPVLNQKINKIGAESFGNEDMLGQGAGAN